MSQIDEVRGAADIVKIVGDYVKLRKAGVNLMGLCPFHQEKTPSFAVHPTKQIFHCFGCGVGGDVFKFVMLIENLSFPEALRRVAERDRVFDRFRRRIIFPISGETGKVAAFGGRALGDEQPKYLNSPETPIYTKGRVLYHLDRAAAAIRKLDYAILVEGYMDCIAVASIGVENVVASCGTSLTENQIRLLARSSRRVVVNYDPDSAGQAATEPSLALLLEAGFEVKVLALPAGRDAGAVLPRPRAAGCP